jgi:hypothetical protein
MFEDMQRGLVELAVSSGKKLTHPVTGFVTSSEPGTEGVILLYDNFLYILALLRSKTHENVLEARKLLERLFFFQQLFPDQEEFGSFPVALHEYPCCSDKMQATHILALLYWVQKEFGHVLANHKLSLVIDRLLDYVASLEVSAFPLWARVKMAAVLHAYGRKCQFPEIESGFLPDPIALSHMMQSYQLAKEAIDWSEFWKLVAATWHPGVMRFAGPSFRGFQEGYCQLVSLYDYFMAAFTGQLALIAKKQGIDALSAAIVRVEEAPFQVALPTAVSRFKGVSNQMDWITYQDEKTSVSIITGAKRQQQVAGFSPFSLLSGTHSLSIEIHKGVLKSYLRGDGFYTLRIELDTDAFVEEKEGNALSIWFDDQKECQVTVAGIKASCFELSEPVLITLGDVAVALSCKVASGDGEFVGHIRRGNRSSQKQLKSKKVAYDQEIFYRAIRGEGPAALELTFRFC